LGGQQQQQQQQQNTQGTGVLKCWYCEKTGHGAWECQRKYKFLAVEAAAAWAVIASAKHTMGEKHIISEIARSLLVLEKSRIPYQRGKQELGQYLKAIQPQILKSTSILINRVITEQGGTQREQEMREEISGLRKELSDLKALVKGEQDKASSSTGIFTSEKEKFEYDVKYIEQMAKRAEEGRETIRGKPQEVETAEKEWEGRVEQLIRGKLQEVETAEKEWEGRVAQLVNGWDVEQDRLMTIASEWNADKTKLMEEHRRVIREAQSSGQDNMHSADKGKIPGEGQMPTIVYDPGVSTNGKGGDLADSKERERKEREKEAREQAKKIVGDAIRKSPKKMMEVKEKGKEKEVYDAGRKILERVRREQEEKKRDKEVKEKEGKEKKERMAGSKGLDRLRREQEEKARAKEKEERERKERLEKQDLAKKARKRERG